MTEGSAPRRVAIVGEDDPTFVEDLRRALQDAGIRSRLLTQTTLRRVPRPPDLTLILGDAAADGGIALIDAVGTERGPFAVLLGPGQLSVRLDARQRGITVVPRADDGATAGREVQRAMAGYWEGDDENEVREDAVPTPAPAAVEGLDWDDDPETSLRQPGLLVPRPAAVPRPGAGAGARSPKPLAPPPLRRKRPSSGLGRPRSPLSPVGRTTIPGGISRSGPGADDVTTPAAASPKTPASASTEDPFARETVRPGRAPSYEDETINAPPGYEGAFGLERPDPDATAPHRPLSIKEAEDRASPPDRPPIPLTKPAARSAGPPARPAPPVAARPAPPVAAPPPGPPAPPVAAPPPGPPAPPVAAPPVAAPPAPAPPVAGPVAPSQPSSSPIAALVLGADGGPPSAPPPTLSPSGPDPAAGPVAVAPAPAGSASTESFPPAPSPPVFGGAAARSAGAAAPVAVPTATAVAPRKGRSGALLGALAIGGLILLMAVGGAAYVVLTPAEPPATAATGPVRGPTNDPVARPVGAEPSSAESPSASPSSAEPTSAEPGAPDPEPAVAVAEPAPAEPAPAEPAAPEPEEETLDPVEARARSDVFVSEGDEHERAGRRREASAAFEQALSIDDSNPHAHAGLARLAMEAGDGPGAVLHAERACALRRRRPEFHVLVGDARRANGDPAGARRAYRRALEVDPEHTEAEERLAE